MCYNELGSASQINLFSNCNNKFPFILYIFLNSKTQQHLKGIALLITKEMPYSMKTSGLMFVMH